MSEKEFRELEEICDKNHNRVRWAEEYSDMREPVLRFPSRKEAEKARKRQRRLHTAMLACAAACGMGVTFLAIGISSMNWGAIVIGGIVVGVFMASGCIFDALVEEGADHV